MHTFNCIQLVIQLVLHYLKIHYHLRKCTIFSLTNMHRCEKDWFQWVTKVSKPCHFFETQADGLLSLQMLPVIQCKAEQYCHFQQDSTSAHHSNKTATAWAGRSPAGAVQSVCYGSPCVSAAQGTIVHDGLQHPQLRHCSTAATVIHWCHQLFIQRHRRSIFGHQAFSVAGPAAWNSLPDYLRDPTRSFDSFRDIKTSIFLFY